MLLLYGDAGRQSVLCRITDLCTADSAAGGQAYCHAAAEAVRCLLESAVRFGFRGNVWHHYLALYLLSHENPFSLLCERCKPEGALLELAKQDMEELYALFWSELLPLQTALGPERMAQLADFSAPEPGEAAGSAVRELTARMEAARSPEEMLRAVIEAYRTNGVGMTGLYRAFRFENGALRPVCRPDPIRLSDIVGNEEQKTLLRENTEAFLAGRSANNVLLYGDSGTGKSSCVRALLNEYPDLRMIELHRYQFRELAAALAQLRCRGFRTILLLDDLSFEAEETEYKYLKAAIEGGVEPWPENVLLYATSNRRHLIRENWSDRNDIEHDGDIHRSDTVEEKLSLAERFGLAIRFDTPVRKEYHRIVRTLAARFGLEGIREEELLRRADAWEIRHGGPSGRVAEQFIRALAGRAD